MDFGTTCYTQETPAFLWDAWTDGGPAGDGYDRYSQRLTELIALDLLLTAPAQLDADERHYAKALVDGLGLAEEVETDV